MKKRILSILLAALMILSLLPTVAFAATVTSLTGSGTAASPYLIGNVDELEFLAEKVNAGDSTYKSAYYQLTADISGFTTPIGVEANPFAGHFNGASHTVTLAMEGQTSNDNVGMFGHLNNGAEVSNVNVAGTVKGKNRVGGVAGKNNGGTISNCVNNATVSGAEQVGGVAGKNDGSIYACVNCGSISAKYIAGGIFGDSNGSVATKNCANYGSIVCDVNSNFIMGGGIAGNNYRAIIENCISQGYVEGKASGTKKSAGGIAGSSFEGSIKNSAAVFGTNATSANAGGVTGNNRDGAVINCYWNTEVTDAPANAVGETGTEIDVEGLTTTDMQADSGENALITKLNGYTEGEPAAYPSDWLKWVKKSGNNYPYLPYYVNIIGAGDGTVTASSTNSYNVANYFDEGDTVTLTLSDSCNGLPKINGANITPDKVNDTTYTFTMPSNNVTVLVDFKGHTHDELTFEAWTDSTKLPDSPGNYYLDTDVNLTSCWNVPVGTEGNPATTNLCLNGHYIKGSLSAWMLVWIKDYAILNIYDEENTAAYKFSVDENNLWAYEGAWNSTSDVESEAVKKVTGGFVSNTSLDIIFINPNGKLTINGGTYTGARNNEGAIHSEGTFIMNAGTICGNYNYYGAGGAVYNDGTFIMNGGTISDNNSNTAGGGIISGNNVSNAVFEMHGGTIECNKATNFGGALYLSAGTATITGGIIQNNETGYYGGGVYSYGGSFTLGGTAVIQGNSLTSGGVNNVELLSENITIGTGAAEPCDGMSIGIKGSGAFTTNGSADYVKYFTSDDPTYYVDFDSTESKLVLRLVESGKHAVTVNTDGNGVVYTDKQTAASGDTVTLTVSANEGYMLDAISVNGGAVSLEQTNDTTYTFAMPNAAAAVSAEFVAVGPSIKVKKIADNPKYGETKTDYELYSVTTANFEESPTLTLQWKNTDSEPATWDGSAPTGVTLGTDGTVTTTTATPAGDYVFRIVTSDFVEGSSGYSSGPITLTVDKAVGSASVSMTGWTYGGTANNPSPTSSTNGTTSVTYQYKLSTAEDSAYADDKPTNAGTYTVKATFAATANYAETTATANFTISKATPAATDFTYSGPTSLTYDGQDKEATVAPAQGVTGMGNVTVKYAKKIDDTTWDTATSSAPTDAGTYKVSISVAEGDNYAATNSDLTNDSWVFTIGKVDYGNTFSRTAEADLKAKNGETVEITLPAIPNGASYGTVTNNNTSYFTVGSINTGTGKVTVTSAKDWDKAQDGTDARTFIVTVTADGNHNNYDITVSVTPVFKTVVTINATASSYTYGTSGKGYTGLSVTDNYVATSALEFLYESTGATPTYSSSSAPTNAGTYKVTISVPADNAAYTGSTTVNFEVFRKPVTVTAKDITVYIGKSVPTLGSSDYTVSGLVSGGDSLDGITLQYETTPDTSAVGTYTILAIDNQANGRRNYDVTCVNGTLTISKKATGSSVTTYFITVEKTENGSISTNLKNASAGSTVTITVAPDKGFTLETLTVLDKNGKEIEVKNLGDNKFSFKMPSSKVTVSATFMDDNTMLNFFVDVKANDYFYDAVLWAAENGITNGVDAVHFGPDAPVTRAQVVTFLWRAAGCPEAEHTAAVFKDVSPDAYYVKAVEWALSEGITKGTSETTFSPDKVCTRGQIVTFLARFAGVADTDTESAFTDVPVDAFFAAAVKWAKDNGVTDGTSATTFEPYTDCTRAQVVTFLYRWMVK